MGFFINFSAVSNSPPPASGLSGLAGYYHIKKPFHPGIPTYTNQLEVFIGLPEMAESGWIFEKEEDGSFTPVAELTNQYPGYFNQNVMLTTNQIYRMISGDLYAEVNFGDSNYLGQLTPQYNFAKGPTAKMVFPTPIGENIASGYTAISPNNRTVKFVFDGSHCTDPFYLPIQYSWVGYTGYSWDPSAIVFTDTNIMTTNDFKIGYYHISLQVGDVIATNQPYGFSLTVMTAGQAVNSFIPLMQSAPMTDKKKRALSNLLKYAAILFDGGHMAMGRTELEVYKKIVIASNFNSRLEYVLLRPMQDVIDALKKTSQRGLSPQFGGQR